jgi:hypothetical protein
LRSEELGAVIGLVRQRTKHAEDVSP